MDDYIKRIIVAVNKDYAPDIDCWLISVPLEFNINHSVGSSTIAMSPDMYALLSPSISCHKADYSSYIVNGLPPWQQFFMDRTVFAVIFELAPEHFIIGNMVADIHGSHGKTSLTNTRIIIFKAIGQLSKKSSGGSL